MDAERVLALAEQVRAGSRVDWAAEAEASGDPQERDIVRNMGLLARIADVHAGGTVTTSLHDMPTVDRLMRDVSEPELPPSRRWGHLERLEFIGKGSFGIVCKAWDPKLQIWVALKLARPGTDGSREDEMLEEARLMARVKHHNVIRIHGADMQDGRFGIWMEFIEGRTLAEIIKFEGKLDDDRARKTARTLALALAAVHNANIIHKDVKAHNVMVESGGRLVLMDFGASIRLENLKGDLDAGGVRGTPYYLAPELFEDQAASNQSDIYSLGVLLFHLLTAEYPVEANSLAELAERQRRGQVRSLVDVRPEVNRDLRVAVDRALARVPAQRYESAGRMADALRARRRDLAPWVIVGLLAVVGSMLGIDAWIKQHNTFDVGASLYRAGPTSEELLSGSRVRPGDELYLEFEASKPLFVYVFNEDDKGTSVLLYPIAGLEPQNPIPADQTHNLPGMKDSVQVTWLVTTAGGRERFWMVGSRKPVPELEELIREMQSAAFDKPAYATVPQGTVKKLRGIGGLSTVPEPQTAAGTPTATDLFNQMTVLAREKEKHRGLWVRRIELANP